MASGVTAVSCWGASLAAARRAVEPAFGLRKTACSSMRANSLAFYDTPMGQVARRMILRRLRLLWPQTAQLPRARLRLRDAVSARLPDRCRARRLRRCRRSRAWSAGRTDAALVALGEEDALPFPDAMFDRILVVHGLEGADAVRPLMRQLWRVLAPEGRILIVAPNRTSLWSQIERSPFAHGRPFHRGELDRLLRACDVRAAALGQRALRPAAQRTQARAHRRGLGEGRAPDCGRDWAAFILSRRRSRSTRPSRYRRKSVTSPRSRVRDVFAPRI